MYGSAEYESVAFLDLVEKGVHGVLLVPAFEALGTLAASYAAHYRLVATPEFLCFYSGLFQFLCHLHQGGMGAARLMLAAVYQ